MRLYFGTRNGWTCLALRTRFLYLHHGTVMLPSSCMLCRQKRDLRPETNFVPVKNDHANTRVDHLAKARSQKGPGALKPTAMPTMLQADFLCGCAKSRFEKSVVMASPKDALPAPSRTSNAMSPTASPGAQNAAAICNSLSARKRT